MLLMFTYKVKSFLVKTIPKKQLDFLQKCLTLEKKIYLVYFQHCLSTGGFLLSQK